MRTPLGRALFVALTTLAGLTGCGEEPRGTKAMGEPCGDRRECRHGLCVAGPSGEDPMCTRSCGSTEDCPRGWSCSGVTGDHVLICSRGAPTPFGVGARE